MEEPLDPLDQDQTPGKKRRVRLRITDKIVIAVALVVLFLLLLPIYYSLRDQRYFQQCQQNMQQLGQAIRLYAIDAGGGLPSAYTLDGTPNSPPSWVVALGIYTKQRSAAGTSFFTCPKAEAHENSLVTLNKEKTPLSYGFYAGVSGALPKNIPDPSRTILIAETSLHGYNPQPLGGNDNSLIAYDDSNFQPTPQSKFVTRLAFDRIDEAQGWQQVNNLVGRHGEEGITVLYADGHLGQIKGNSMQILRAPDGDLLSPWQPAKP